MGLHVFYELVEDDTFIFIQNTSLQLDNNHLNKKDFVFFGTGQNIEVFQVKGSVFSFRDHVKN